MEKIMVLYRKLLNYDLLWKKKLLYYGKNSGTLPRTMELRFMKGKNMINYQKQRNSDL